ncbi:MAG TPA: transglutaminase-like domain-containing protein [Planctomycetota bacterium]|nr:transglutaminase-like domain-containing protein [Planctomycetota bacterium]
MNCDALPFFPPDPRDLPAPPGELYRRRVRAYALLQVCEEVDSERRGEISRELLMLGTDALPALSRAAAGRKENTAALARSLVRLLVPDEVGRQIYLGIIREKRDYQVEHGAVLLSRLPYPNLPVQRVMREIDELAKKAAEFVYTNLGITRDEARKVTSERTLEIVKSLGEFWREEGFHGSSENFYNDRNSYLPDVMERRTGLPIALSVLYLAIARRMYLKAEGVGMPGHFIVRVRVVTDKGEQFLLIDPFNGAHALNLDECRQRVEAVGQPFIPDEHLKATPPKEILARMCNNLLALFDNQKKVLDAERVATVLVHLQPRDPVPLLIRAERRLRRGERRGARLDFEHAAQLDPTGPVGRTAEELLRRMEYEYPFR